MVLNINNNLSLGHKWKLGVTTNVVRNACGMHLLPPPVS